jgi:glycosyltransferase involved in cell wall biosynthesis
MSLDPLVSVVIPSYNRAHVIGQTLDSVLAQTYRNLEVIVVDDGSRDATEMAVEPYRDRITYVRQENGGLAAARNAGLERARGEYVAWLDSDDLWNPEKIALQVAVLRRHPDLVLCASDFSAFDEEGFFEESHVRAYYSVLSRTPGGLAGFFPRKSELDTRAVPGLSGALPPTVHLYLGEVFEELVGGNCLHPPTVVYRRDAGERAGLLDSSFQRDSDYEYFLRLSQLGPIAYIDLPLMRYRYSPDQMSSDRYLAEIAHARVLVLESLHRREPRLLESEQFRRRLGSSHLAAAHTLAERARLPAVEHLLTSLQWRYVDGDTVKTLVKLCLPRWALQLYRKRPGAARA